MRPTATPHCGRRNVEPGARGSGNEIVSDAVATLPAGMVGAGAGAAVTAFATGGERATRRNHRPRTRPRRPPPRRLQPMLSRASSSSFRGVDDHAVVVDRNRQHRLLTEAVGRGAVQVPALAPVTVTVKDGPGPLTGESVAIGVIPPHVDVTAIVPVYEVSLNVASARMRLRVRAKSVRSASPSGFPTD